MGGVCGRATRSGSDASDPWYRGLALYYTSAGKLWRAVWERWMQDAYGNVIPGTYSREKGREFYYDGPRQRYLSRALDVSSEYPSQWKPTEEPQLWTDYLGDDPYADFQVVEKQDPQQKWYIESQTETLGYLAGYGTHAQQDQATGATRYLHGDLIRSTMLTTDQGGTADETLAYTAFGEPVGPGGVGVPPASDTRYRYAGGWGYEDDLLKLDGAPGTKPIVLLHVGSRWYDPRVGRFVQRDPIGPLGGFNVYAYVDNAPTSSVDPLGLDRWHCGGFGHSFVEVDDPDAPGCFLAIDFYPANFKDWFGPGVVKICRIKVPSDERGPRIPSTPDEDRQMIDRAKALQACPPDYNILIRNCHCITADLLDTPPKDPRPPPVCLVEGTLVSSGGVPIPVEALRVSDVVDSGDGANGDTVCDLVTSIRVGFASALIKITLEGETIGCTGAHPFWVRGRGWTLAADLRAGDFLQDACGAPVVIIDVARETARHPVRVYDLTVGTRHTYFVGWSRVLVHNKPPY